MVEAIARFVLQASKAKSVLPVYVNCTEVNKELGLKFPSVNAVGFELIAGKSFVQLVAKNTTTRKNDKILLFIFFIGINFKCDETIHELAFIEMLLT
jgi:hypothetical protein